MAAGEGGPAGGVPPKVSRSDKWADVGGGVSLGLLLGMLVGMSAAPVVSTVVTGLVALLAGFFGFSDKVLATIPSGAARRLMGFGVAAAVIIPLAVWMRTSEFLTPSVESQKKVLVEMGVTDPKELKDLLKFQRLGLMPSGAAVAAKDTVAPRGGYLYSIPSGFCANLARLKDAPVEDLTLLFESGSEDTKRTARSIAAMSPDRQKAAYEAAAVYFCG